MRRVEASATRPLYPNQKHVKNFNPPKGEKSLTMNLTQNGSIPRESGWYSELFGQYTGIAEKNVKKQNDKTQLVAARCGGYLQFNEKKETLLPPWKTCGSSRCFFRVFSLGFFSMTQQGLSLLAIKTTGIGFSQPWEVQIANRNFGSRIHQKQLTWATVKKPGVPYFPLNPGWLIGILISWFMKFSLYNWVVHHPLYNPTNRLVFFRGSHGEFFHHVFGVNKNIANCRAGFFHQR